MKTYILIAATLFLTSCGEEKAPTQKPRFEISRVDKPSDHGPITSLFRDTKTGREYLVTREWVQPLPFKKADGILEEE